LILHNTYKHALFSGIKTWNDFLTAEVEAKRISSAVFKPVVHMLSHLGTVIRACGGLRCISGRLLERLIGKYNISGLNI
jgi:hypothetical protein